jgi:UDP-N-acetyl-D-glucosamine/UDP-N-acetyl-D-galactosamine dehydrogenase
MTPKDDIKIAIIGLGYVGLPLALEFSKRFPVIGFDINERRIAELRAGRDSTREADASVLSEATGFEFTSDAAGIVEANVYIVTVPTPIDEHKRPDLRPLISASETIGKLLEPGNVVIYESTVYPGCTQEECVPILERESGLTCALEAEIPSPGSGGRLGVGQPSPEPDLFTAFESEFPPPASGGRTGGGQAAPEFIAAAAIESSEAKGEQIATKETNNQKTKKQFFVGYSPERINPGDREHRLPNIKKVTSGSTKEAAEFVDTLYAEIITAGTHKAQSIRVAEAAKVIENTQRDVNIGLINELAMLFGKLGLDTGAVLEAAGTKWNFLPFRPGLVGGHCIGVDPYYLTHKAQHIGFHPQMILAGRRTNDGMGAYVAGELVKLMAKKGVYRPSVKVLVLGLTFKENCPDLRNTRVVDVIAALKDYNLEVEVHDPWADAEQARAEYGLDLLDQPEQATYDAIILAVAHNVFRDLANPGIRSWATESGVVYDLKHVLPDDQVDARL